jgi:hypothetical protein
MPGGAGQLSGAAAVRAPAQVPSPRSRPGWPSAPSAVTWVRSGRPAGGRRRGDVRTLARPVVALSASSGPAVGRPSSRSSGRPVSRRPVSRCLDGQAPLSAAMPPRGPRRAGPGGAGCGDRPAGRSGSRCPRWPRAGGHLPASGLTGCEWCGGWPCPAATRSIVARGPTFGRRPGCSAAWAAGPTRGWSRARCRPGGGVRDAAGAHRSPQGGWAVAGVVPDQGLDQAVVTTLSGRSAGWSHAVRFRKAQSVRWGSSLRPQRGRGV